MQILEQILSLLCSPDRNNRTLGITLAISQQCTQEILQALSPMIFVEGGTFKMGSLDRADERPVHEVSLDSFYIGQFQVTQALYELIMGKTMENAPPHPLCPAENMSWYEAILFCNQLSECWGLENYYNIDKNTKDPNNISRYDLQKWTINCKANATGFRLLTEAEWEFAAQGGSQGNNHPYQLDEVAWYYENNHGASQRVDSKAPNCLGIYGMLGNVWEWCWDWSGTYEHAAQHNPTGKISGSNRVLRGGAWNNYMKYCTPSYRNYDGSHLHHGYGCRVARTAQPQK